MEVNIVFFLRWAQKLCKHFCFSHASFFLKNNLALKIPSSCTKLQAPLIFLLYISSYSNEVSFIFKSYTIRHPVISFMLGLKKLSLAWPEFEGFLDREAGCFLLMKYGWGRHTPSGRVRKLNAIYYLRYPMMNWIWSKIWKLRPQGGLDKQNYSFTRNFPVDWLTYSMQPDSVLQSMCRQY